MTAFIHILLVEEKNLPFTVCGIGSQEKQCTIQRKNGYPLHQLIFSKHGEGIVTIQDKKYILHEGDYVYLKANEPHHYEPTTDMWSTDWIQFNGQYIDETLNALDFIESKCFSCKSMSKVSAHFQKILFSIQSNNPLKGHLASTQLYELLIMLFENNTLLRVEKGKQNHPQLQPVLNYIDSNFSTDISLDTLAAIGSITPQHLCKIFKDSLHMRPFEYIIKRRLQEAKRLLVETSLPINVISSSVGYEDNSYFGMLFKRYEGITASSYRGQV